ncbi:MAG: hypothetical protein OSB62_02455 [Alphaproteobacteria bacterium]|nr:hypothetical protein [Alphaproteobacteria bacterium]
MRNFLNTTALNGAASHLALGPDAIIPQYEPLKLGSFMRYGDNIIALGSGFLITQEVYTPANDDMAA